MKPKIRKIIDINTQMRERKLPPYYVELLCYKAVDNLDIYNELMRWETSKDYSIIQKLIKRITDES